VTFSSAPGPGLRANTMQLNAPLACDRQLGWPSSSGIGRRRALGLNDRRLLRERDDQGLADLERARVEVAVRGLDGGQRYAVIHRDADERLAA